MSKPRTSFVHARSGRWSMARIAGETTALALIAVAAASVSLAPMWPLLQSSLD